MRSLGELRIALPMPLKSLGVVLREVVRRNRVRDGIVYLQVTRGVAPRDHAFPTTPVGPSVVVTARSLDRERGEKTAGEGISVITVPENRWPRVDIKSVSLLPNVLAKQAAREQGAKEAWFVDQTGNGHRGLVQQCLDRHQGRQGRDPRRQRRESCAGLRAPCCSTCCEPKGLTLDERPFTVDEAFEAREAFVTSASQIVMPVVQIDGRPVANGAPGLRGRRVAPRVPPLRGGHIATRMATRQRARRN